MTLAPGIERLAAAFPRHQVLLDAAARTCYSIDASQRAGETPAVVLVESGEDLATALRICAEERLAFVARGRGTGYTGGCVPCGGAVVISLERWRGVAAQDPVAQDALVLPGTTLGELNAAVRPLGLFFPVDPISKEHCTLGGLIAENGSGPRCLVYGPAHQFLLGYELFAPDGGRRWVAREDPDFYAPVSAEGTVGVIGAARVRLVATPAAVALARLEFDDLRLVSSLQELLYGARREFSAMEMITPSLHPGRGSCGAYSLWIEQTCASDAAADEVFAWLAGLVAPIPVRIRRESGDLFACRGAGYRASRAAIADSLEARPVAQLIDGVVPRRAIAAAIDAMLEIARDEGCPMTHTFHFGDGNIHPTFFHSAGPAAADGKERVLERVTAFCLAVGGSLGGEHGIGLEKARYLERRHQAFELAKFRSLKARLDPTLRSNPGKIMEFAAAAAPPPDAPSPEVAETGCAVDATQMTVRVDLRWTVSQLRQAVADAGFFLACEAFGDDSSQSVAELMESESPNLLSPRYGAPKDQLLGLAIALGEPGRARRVELGSSLVKDISGFQLHRLPFAQLSPARPVAATIRIWHWPRSRAVVVHGRGWDAGVVQSVVGLSSDYAVWLTKHADGQIRAIFRTDTPIQAIAPRMAHAKLTVSELETSSPSASFPGRTLAAPREIASPDEGLDAIVAGRASVYVPQLRRAYRWS